MTLSKPVYKRAQPLLGTIVEITLMSDGRQAQEAVDVAFLEIHRLEKILNFHDKDSGLSQFNRVDAGTSRKVESELFEVIKFSHELWLESGGLFNPFIEDLPCESVMRFANDRIEKLGSFRLDLGGVAKGYAVDRAVEVICDRFSGFSGVVSAGGDLRFFGDFPKAVTLRLGTSGQLIFRDAVFTQQSVATSSFLAAELGVNSSTSYRLKTNRFDRGWTVVAVSDTCMMADAFTKIAMGADYEISKRCADRYSAQLIIFDSTGNPIYSIRAS